MKTGGYDLVVEMGESLPNKLALAYYYMGRFPKLQGTYVLPLRNVPEKLAPLTVIDYDIKLKIPVVDFIASNTVRLSISAEALLTVVGMPLKVEVGFTVDASALYDEGSRHLMADLRKPKVTAEINDERVSAKALDALNNILATVLAEYLARETPFIDLSPFISYSIALPGVDAPFSLRFGSFKITDDMLAAGINVLDRTAGRIGRIEDFRESNDLAFGISEAAMNRVLSFWWENGPVQKRIENRGESHVEDRWKRELVIDSLLASIAPPFGLIAGLMTKVQGFVFRYETVIELEKPRINIRPGNRVAVDGEMRFHFSIGLFFVYKVRKSLKKWKTRSEKIASWTDDWKIKYAAQAALTLDGQGNLSAKLDRLTVWFRGMPKVLGAFINTFANITADHMLRKYPPLQLGSLPISRRIPDTQLTLQVTPNLTTTDYEALVSAAVRIRGLEHYPPAPYIANRSPRALEVHAPSCRWMHLIKERNQVPYYSLQEAHADGYDNCFYCLGDSQR